MYPSTAKQRLWLTCLGYDAPPTLTGPEAQATFEGASASGRYQQPATESQLRLASLYGLAADRSASCNDAAFHKSRVVHRWVANRSGRVVLHYLPSRAPEENPVELVFWRLHETVTRNHRHETINELVEAATEWLEVKGAGRSPIETYNLAA